MGKERSLRIRLYVLRIRDFPYNPMTWGWDWDHQSYEFSGGVWILRGYGFNLGVARAQQGVPGVPGVPWGIG